MSKKRHRLPRARPRIVDRIQLAMSTSRHLDGIWIGSWRGRPEDLARVEGALLLIKQHSPLDYARIARELERVWVSLLPHSLGEYTHSLRGCILDERYVADPATTVEQIASTIVHETTHKARTIRDRIRGTAARENRDNLLPPGASLCSAAARQRRTAGGDCTKFGVVSRQSRAVQRCSLSRGSRGGRN